MRSAKPALYDPGKMPKQRTRLGANTHQKSIIRRQLLQTPKSNSKPSLSVL